ncbi:ABC transporter permease [Natronolimnohabitans innermongolicus]|uniref:ABC-2 type transporter n=1 Tax=Natronolimnohabitans innermongolicus JCM 12255 TaxID=1227499 RepID=L9X2E2_9EURY|nr:ABC transporter permease [Natronolimnohabitans innermongolicus]ELY54758.1 ABC-2 type transporter [Natronolimnohabitans innermongolicus JCM 12255]
MSTDTGAGTKSDASESTASSINLESVRAVAKKDFQDAVRSWVFWGLSAFFFLLIVGITGSLAYFGEDIAAEGATTAMLVFFASETTRLVIPLIALVLGWKSIAGERESGSIKILLSLPHSRKDVLLGKLLGRSAVLSLSLIVGFVAAAAVVAALLGGFDVVDYAALLLMAMIYGVAYTSIAVSLSSLTKSTTVAGAAMFSVFLLFYGVWNGILEALQQLMNRGTIDGVSYTAELTAPDGTTEEITQERLPDWALFVDMIDPGNAFQNTITVLSSTGGDELGTAYPEYYFADDVPFYLENWFSFIILLIWIVVPIAVALYRFDRVDL